MTTTPSPNSRISALIAAMAVATCGIATTQAQAQAQTEDFSIVGTWQQEPKGSCADKLVLSADGRIQVESHEERLSGTYTFEVIIDNMAHGRLTRVITSSNEKPDCLANVTRVHGNPQSAYVFLSGHDRMEMCREQKGQRCFARFRRQP